MSAQVTEGHRELARTIRLHLTLGQAYQVIADSEARACAELRAEVERLKHGTVAQFKDAFIDELKRENAQLREWQAGVIANERLHHAERKEAIARAERAEAELAGIRALANRRNKRDHSQDTTHQLVAALDQALDIAQAELATERARIADLVADLNDACITLTSAEEDCDDYAMQNTRFKLTAVREVLLQHVPNAAMKEETK